MSGEVYELSADQAAAADPGESVWLSASAGTGKTQVLSARVLRLLLQEGTEPSELLCLTFTKAGAAEMATRVNDVLARWVRLDSETLAKELNFLGADVGEESKARARSLFARVLDCPGGGLRIDTIHAFAQWLLAAFPEEAGLQPGTKAMEDRDRELLSHQVLSDLLEQAELQGDVGLLDNLASLSVKYGPDGARKWLMRCAEAGDLWFGPGAWQPPFDDRLKQLLGLPAGAGEDWLADLCGDGCFDTAAVLRVIAVNQAWNTATGTKLAGICADWLAGDAMQRLDRLGDLKDAVFTQKGEIRSLDSLRKFDPDYATTAEAVRSALVPVVDAKALLDLVKWLGSALEIGRRFALAWDEAKKREGFVDFDDQIREAAKLLATSDLAEWIRFKLDRRFNHILVDEAQDTNAAQWSIIEALTGDFFTGEGQHDDLLRTIFVVGDYKQAIFGFQGTSPENFAAARERYRVRLQQAAENARAWRGKRERRPLLERELGESFRSTKPVLDFVNHAIETLGHESFGLDRAPDDHRGFLRPGTVVLWNPVRGAEVDDEGEDGAGGASGAEDAGPEAWLPKPERLMADKIAKQVKHWLDQGFALQKSKDGPRRATAGDIMVLVRKRRELAGLIVARLHAAGVPVAGVDRLRLGGPLGVKDLMAALRFAVQPGDDLSLASLLVSPLIGWSQDELLRHGYRPEQRDAAGKRIAPPPLWEFIKDQDDPLVAETASRLRDLLRGADFDTPQALLHWILTGPWRGRQRLVARLGSEVNDPVDELLNAAQAYASAHVPSLQGFIRWFDAGEGELKREAGANRDQVRVMTVHGAKGLQAPIVILADATGNPQGRARDGFDLELEEHRPGSEAAQIVPMPQLSRQERVGQLAAAYEAAKAAEMREHWRLLYVAMTRAEEALFIGGALLKSEKLVAEQSWYARLEPLFDADTEADENWGGVRHLGDPVMPMPRTATEADAKQQELPAWATTQVGPEPRPPRPLAPSSAGEDHAAAPPLPEDLLRDAARRGVLIHRLLERLPDVPEADRAARGAAWLARRAEGLDARAQAEILQSVLAVIGDPGFAEVFGSSALAEVPLAALVEGQVIAGTADRLLITDDTIMVVDFKSARRPPVAIDQVPLSTRRQMVAYAAALEAIYPGRKVRAALLYTQTPQLIEVPPEMLAADKLRLSTSEQSFASVEVE